MKVLERKCDELTVKQYENRDQMGKAAAEAVGAKICELLEQQDEVRIVFACAPSQDEFLYYLCRYEGIDWSRVVAMHQDEWVGVEIDQPHSFAGFLKKYLIDIVHPGKFHLINSLNDAEAECERYGNLLTEKGIDIICLGVGENGHTAFNEPHEADFNDPKIMKIIQIDERCRQQQFNDFDFETIDDVPTHGITITIPAIMAARNIYCMVPGIRKAEAVHNVLLGEICEQCPSSVLRRAPHATLFLDADSASML